MSKIKCNKRFRKECYECDFKDIDQKIFAELEDMEVNLDILKFIKTKPKSLMEFEALKKLKQKFGVDNTRN